MNNSDRFTQAHKIARQTVAIVGNYQIAFTIALRDTYKPTPFTLPTIDNDTIDDTSVVIGLVLFVAFTVILSITMGGFNPLALVTGMVLSGGVTIVLIMFVKAYTMAAEAFNEYKRV